MHSRLDESVVLVDGPWSHREVSANGARFHIAEAGSGPLILLLHGFPEFWWAWRHQLPALADAGYRVVAPDLRGYGASDKTPRGYDAYTLCADVAGLVRALGERDAVVVGHDWGGLLAWSAATLHPAVVRRLVVLSTPHPRRLRQALARHPAQLLASWYILAAQTPVLAERYLLRDDAAAVGQMLREWSGPGFPDAEIDRRCRDAMQLHAAAHCALEYYRWSVRSLIRPSGLRYARLLRQPVAAPTLQLHGLLDTCLLPRTAEGSGRFVSGEYEYVSLPGVGHFPHEEAPEAVNQHIARWAAR